jgi:hypothetical protein
MGTGLYRDELPWLGECVYMDWGSFRNNHEHMTRKAYETNGYQPPFERLPTRAQYEGRMPKGSRGVKRVATAIGPTRERKS